MLTCGTLTAAEATRLFGPLLFKVRVMSPRPGEAKHGAVESGKVLAELLAVHEDLFAIEVCRIALIFC